MNVAQIISEKRDGKTLDEKKMRFIVEGYANDRVPDYQMAAFAMAVLFQGMTDDETEVFTRCMIESGDRLSWTDKPAVDKHSTGGIGDKISIHLAPMLACCDVQVPMISGRGLGATGGTLDKLESIPGFRCELSNDEFRSIVNWNGCAIAGASAFLAPADKKLYALRDVTGTVHSIPLITGSILSKKVAEGIDALILDVKWGSGAFMKTLDDARKLAQSLVRVGNRLGVKTSAIITDMNQPLGQMIGNAVEVDESLAVLRGEGPADVFELTLELGARLLVAVGIHSDRDRAKDLLSEKIRTGEALKKFEEMVDSQGGELAARREIAQKQPVESVDSGYISQINAERLGLAVIEMGGGRKQLDDRVDHSVGIEFLVRIGDRIEPGQPLANIFCNGPAASYASSLIQASVSVSENPVDPPTLIVEAIQAVQ